jgi:hypothetical protein
MRLYEGNKKVKAMLAYSKIMLATLGKMVDLSCTDLLSVCRI